MLGRDVDGRCSYLLRDSSQSEIDTPPYTPPTGLQNCRRSPPAQLELHAEELSALPDYHLLHRELLNGPNDGVRPGTTTDAGETEEDSRPIS